MTERKATELRPVDLKLPRVKAKHLAPILRDLAGKLETISRQKGVAEELEEVARRLEGIQHGERINVPICLRLECENGGGE